MTDKTSDIVLIHAYLSDEERKSVFHKFIKQFKSFGYDVIITSHLPLDKDTQELVDYAIYDKENTLIDDPAYKGYLIHYCYAPDGKVDVHNTDKMKPASSIKIISLQERFKKLANIKK